MADKETTFDQFLTVRKMKRGAINKMIGQINI